MSPLLKIDRNVPFPGAAKAGRKRIYPFRELKVGESFFVPASVERAPAQIQGVLAAAARYQAPNRKFTTRREANGVRVWRVA